MYKHVHRVLLTLSRKAGKGAMLSTTGFNKFLIPIPTLPKISLTVLNCSFAKRNFSREIEYSDADSDLDSDSESESEFYLTKRNPSVEVQKKIQQEAQERLDDLLEKDAELNKLYKILELENDVLRQSGLKVPDTIKPTDWLHLIKIKSQNSRKYVCLFILYLLLFFSLEAEMFLYF